jgi:hypothetical protein
MSAAPTTTTGAHDEPSEQERATSMAVMRTGHTLSRDLQQELAALVATTAQRERLRKRTSMVLALVGGLAVAYVAISGAGTPRSLPMGLFAFLCLAPVLPATLLWGVRNRALLNVAADNAAVDHKALARAVRLVEKNRAGPSTALATVLQTRAR